MSDTKHRLVAAVLGLLLTLSLGACGDDDPSEPNMPEPTSNVGS
ncbi:MAG: hypothetical protein R3290_00240 [Acidimicrobiia bacterium]|nr:hypothetical protein [Acidimicrobiia bacterium]